MQNAALSFGSHLIQSIHPWSYIGAHPFSVRDPPTRQNNSAISQVVLVQEPLLCLGSDLYSTPG